MGFQKRDLESVGEVCLVVSNDQENGLGPLPFDEKIASGNTKMEALHNISPCKTEIDEIAPLVGAADQKVVFVRKNFKIGVFCQALCNFISFCSTETAPARASLCQPHARSSLQAMRETKVWGNRTVRSRCVRSRLGGVDH